MGTPTMGWGARLPSDLGAATDLVLLVFERRRVAAASRRGPEAENVGLRPTGAAPAAARAKASLTRGVPGDRSTKKEFTTEAQRSR